VTLVERLQALCDDRPAESPRAWQRQPFAFGDALVATNGWALVTAPGHGETAKVDAYALKQAKKIIDTISEPPVTAISVPRSALLAWCEPCDPWVAAPCGCNGTGEVSCGDCYGEGYCHCGNKCSSCDGEGSYECEECDDGIVRGLRKRPMRPGRIVDLIVDRNLLRTILLALQGEGALVWRAGGDMLAIACGEARGVLMACLPYEGAEIAELEL
jgi:hypothetical protein